MEHFSILIADDEHISRRPLRAQLKPAGRVVGLLLVVAACAPRPSQSLTAGSFEPAAVESGRRIVSDVLTREHLPGLAITVSAGTADPVVWREGFGFADLESQAPAAPHTAFRVGSVSKPLTATVLLRLWQQGAVDLDTPIGATMAALPPHLHDLTLRQLAGHLGGVRHYRGNEFLSRTAYATMQDAIGVFADDSLVAAPGSRYVYSSYGYNLIGAVLEAATGRPFTELVRREVTQPLGMTATVPDVRGARNTRRARLYWLEGAVRGPAPDDDLSGRWPAGGYLSTTDDLVRLGRAVIDAGLLSTASLDLIRTPQQLASGEPTSVGIGWRIGVDAQGRSYLHHGGSSNGGTAFLLVYPAEQLVVAMAANAFAQWGERDALAVAAVFLDAVARSRSPGSQSVRTVPG